MRTKNKLKKPFQLALTSMKSFLWIDDCRAAGNDWPHIWSQFWGANVSLAQTEINLTQKSIRGRLISFWQLYFSANLSPSCLWVSCRGSSPPDGRTSWLLQPCCCPMIPTCSGCGRWKAGLAGQQIGIRRSRRCGSSPGLARWPCRRAS